MQKSISVIIPTLQKNPNFSLLLETLDKDQLVQEIIIIDNSCKGIHYNSRKIKILEVEKNIFVNPAWNLGIKYSSCEYWCLMNDDIMIPHDFCSKVLPFLNPEVGIVGIDSHTVKEVDNNEYISTTLPSTDLQLKEIQSISNCFGIAIFGHKSAYNFIPEELKIFYGDNYLFRMAHYNKRKCFAIIGQEIFHLGSISSAVYSEAQKNEDKIYKEEILKSMNLSLARLNIIKFCINFFIPTKKLRHKLREKFIQQIY